MKKRIFTSCFLALNLAFSSVSANALKYFNNWGFPIPIYCEVSDDEYPGIDRGLGKFIPLEKLKKMDNSLTEKHVINPSEYVEGELDYFTKNFIVLKIIWYKGKNRMLCVPSKFLFESTDMFVRGFKKIYIQKEWWGDDFVAEGFREKTIHLVSESPFCRVFGSFEYDCFKKRGFLVISHFDIFHNLSEDILPNDIGKKEGEITRPIFVNIEDEGITFSSIEHFFLISKSLTTTNQRLTEQLNSQEKLKNKEKESLLKLLQGTETKLNFTLNEIENLKQKQIKDIIKKDETINFLNLGNELLKKDLFTASKDIERIWNEKKDLKKNISELTVELENLKVDYNKLEEKVEKQVNKNKNLNKQNQKLQKDLSQKEKNLEELKQKEEEFKKLKEKQKQLEKLIQEKYDFEKKQLPEDFILLEQNLNRELMDIEKKTNLNEECQINQDLQEKIKRQIEKNKILKEQNQNLQNINQQLEQNFKKASEELEKFKKKQERQNQTFKKQNQNLQNINQQLEQNFKKASEELEELKKKQNQNFENVRQQLEQKEKELEEFKNKQTQQIQILEKQNQNLQNTNLQLQQDFKKTSEELEELKKKQEENLKQVKPAQESSQEINKLKDELERKDKEILILNHQLSVVQKKHIEFSKVNEKSQAISIVEEKMEVYKLLSQIALNFLNINIDLKEKTINCEEMKKAINSAISDPKGYKGTLESAWYNLTNTGAPGIKEKDVEFFKYYDVNTLTIMLNNFLEKISNFAIENSKQNIQITQLKHSSDLERKQISNSLIVMNQQYERRINVMQTYFIASTYK